MPPVILPSLARQPDFEKTASRLYKNSSAPVTSSYHTLPSLLHTSLLSTMSAIHMPYDSPPFARTPRDAAYEMADALDLRQFTFPPGAAGQYNLAPYDLSRRQHQMGYQPGSFELQYPLDDSHMFSHPHMAHPIPRRPLSPGLYASESHTAAFGEAHHWADSTFPHSVSAPAFSEAFEEFGQPSMFVNPVKVEGKDEAQAAEAPAPPPSWSMSGSLDPTTGIYQMAPEHPRVRTAQACEKCRGRKAKVCPLSLCTPLAYAHQPIRHTVQRRTSCVPALPAPRPQVRVRRRAQDAWAQQGQEAPRDEGAFSSYQRRLYHLHDVLRLRWIVHVRRLPESGEQHLHHEARHQPRYPFEPARVRGFRQRQRPHR